MKTPGKFIELLDRKVLTTEMVASVIYSLNKRAKNWKQKHPDKYRKAKRLRNWDLCTIKSEYYERTDPYPILEYYKKKDYILLKLLRKEKQLFPGKKFMR